MRAQPITIENITYSSLREAARETGITRIAHRLRQGLPLNDQRNLHLHEIEVDGVTFASLTEACKFFSLSYSLVSGRLNQHGWTIDEAFEIVTRPDNSRRGGIVYLVTHTETQKSYVGITFRSQEERWGEHVADSKVSSERGLHAAIQQYGEQAFKVTVLHEGCEPKLLEKLEREEIARRGTLAPNGFNLSKGGGVIETIGRAVVVNDIKYKSIAAACTAMQKNAKTVAHRLQKLGWTIQEAFDLLPRSRYPFVVVNDVAYTSLIEAYKVLKPNVTRQAIWWRLKHGWTSAQAFEIGE